MSEYNMKRGLQNNRVYRNAVHVFLDTSSAVRFFKPADTEEEDLVMVVEQTKFIQLVAACIFSEDILARNLSEKLKGFGPLLEGLVWPYLCALSRDGSHIRHANSKKQALHKDRQIVSEIPQERPEEGGGQCFAKAVFAASGNAVSTEQRLIGGEILPAGHRTRCPVGRDA